MFRHMFAFVRNMPHISSLLPGHQAASRQGSKGDAVVRKQSKITVLLDSREFERFEAYCSKSGFKKSTLIARLIREHLDSQGFRAQTELPLPLTEKEKR
jgi:hypothetical protein